MADENSIGGKVELDITDFKANIAQLNREIKVIESGFKATAAGMADWGNSIDGLEGRITSLNQITDLQAQKIANLKAEYEKVAAAKGADSKAAQDLEIRINRETEAYNRNQLQLQQMTSRLDGLTSELQQVETETQQASKAMDGFGDGLETTGSNLQEIGGNIVGTFGAMAAGIAASLGLAVKAVDDSAASLKKLQSQTGATDTEMKGLKTILDDLYKQNYGENYDDLASSLATVKQVTGENGEELKKLTQNAIAVRDTFGFDVSESIRSAQSLMKQFGISGDEAYNLITQGAQNGLNKNGDMLDTINEYAPQFKALGFDSDQFFNTILNGAKAGGWSVDKLGDAVKEFNIRAKDGSKTTAEGFAALGLNVKETEQAFAKGGKAGVDAFQKVIGELVKIEDPVKRNQIGVKLFGTQFEDLEFGAVAALGKVNGEVDKSNNSLKKLQDNRFGTLGSALSALGRTISTDIVKPLGEQLIPVAESFIEVVKKIAAAFSNLSPATKQFIAIGGLIAGIVAGIATAVGVVLSVIGSAVAGFGALSAAVSAVVSVIGGVVAVISAPVALIVAAIAALVAAGVAIYKNWDTIKAKADEVWVGIKNTITQVGVEISAIWDSIKSYLSNLWEGIKTVASAAWEGIKSAVETIVNPFVLGITNLFNGMKGGLETILNGLKMYFEGIWEIIKNVFLGAVLLIVDLVTLDFKGFAKDAESIFNNLKTAFGTVWEGIKTVFTGAVTAIKGFVSAAWTNIKTNTETVFNAVKGFIESIWTGIKTAFTGALTAIGTAVSGGFESLRSGIETKMNAAKTNITTIWGKVQKFFEDIDLMQIGKDIIQGLIDGITSMAKDLYKKAEDIANSIKTTIKEALKISSPSKVMALEVGKWIPAGIGVGITDNLDAVVSASNKMARAAIPGVPKASTISNNNSTEIVNNYHINATIPAKDLKEVKDVHDLFSRLKQTSRAYGM